MRGGLRVCHSAIQVSVATSRSRDLCAVEKVPLQQLSALDVQHNANAAIPSLPARIGIQSPTFQTSTLFLPPVHDNETVPPWQNRQGRRDVVSPCYRSCRRRRSCRTSGHRRHFSCYYRAEAASEVDAATWREQAIKYTSTKPLRQ